MANEIGPFKDATHPDIEWDIRACVVRFEPGVVNPDGSFQSGGPYIHANETHVAVGALGVHIDSSGRLEVINDGGAPIGSITCTPDESLVARGIDLGPSGGAPGTRFIARQDGVGRLYLNLQADWDAIAGETCNVWLAWLTPRVRSTGRPSPTDRIAELEEKVADLQRRTPGSVARFNQHLDGQSIAQLNTSHDGQNIAQFNEAYAQI
ncbi:hypothetical protein [Jiangella asiatica]|uniref:Uncharacterized protein n=1 Tax=Jiangella asiatica TaxID=2530372 RepID=A0A4R5CRG6_9ACTN|nr:hypothetical protein [Jiangella asiatica]TDE02826.1 hypothetical protein E1269_21280 [Jiangella asiatica]